ncbi:MAG TPA: chemotaxis response regulator protein-glutamate methylesterase [Firmicutes bacterium]|jgi:two-component system chemotaxis response regulator CheB|nr:chemotaxis response regulator protein-glutamate methylesterase [Bacillota bacterium]HHT42705.1 chemotaxis response regulator protein-glutamate methylesterase [Bacillota bacterium]
MPIRVLVVDDSAFMRKLIMEIINAQPDLEVAGYARNGEDALRKLDRLEVDVVTLDVEMPIMDGLETLKRIMSDKPRPVVMLSSRTRKGSETTIQALSLGAVDFVSKPVGSIAPELDSIADELVDKIRCAAMAQLPQKAKAPTAVKKRPVTTFPPLPEGAASKIVIIGSSTGGPKAIEEVFAHIPENLPAGIVVVQHMPKDFTRSFAERLNSIFPFPVKEAQTGDVVENGKVLIAPGDYHLVITPERRVELNQEDRVMFLRPAIDVTMESLPEVYGKNIIGVILTGMGRDGARGMAKIKKAGGLTIAQDRATSTIYSMPKAVADEGNADYILPLDKIGGVITELISVLK